MSQDKPVPTISHKTLLIVVTLAALHPAFADSFVVGEIEASVPGCSTRSR
jgi:hypothetical protein